MLKSEEEIKLHPWGMSRLAFGAHAFDNQHQYLFHVTEHKMKLHQRDYFRKKLLNRLDWVERCWRGQGWRVGQHPGHSRPPCRLCSLGDSPGPGVHVSPLLLWLLMFFPKRSHLVALSFLGWALEQLQNYSYTACLIFFLSLILTFS